MEALILTRAAFGALALPIGVLFGAVLGIVVVIFLFSVFWLLGVLAIAAIVFAIALYARWERGKFPGETPR